MNKLWIGMKVWAWPLVILSLGIAAYAYSSSVVSAASDPSVQRTQKYLVFVDKIKSDQGKLNEFLSKEQKSCQLLKPNGGTLQLTPQGLLECTPNPQAAAVPIQPPGTTGQVKK